MKTVHISLNSIDKVKAFVNEITKFDNDFVRSHPPAGKRWRKQRRILSQS